jgi:hypothetical protein
MVLLKKKTTYLLTRQQNGSVRIVPLRHPEATGEAKHFHIKTN